MVSDRTSTGLYLGIDGGGTACKARLCDADGRVLGEATTGPANTTQGIERCFGEIRRAAEQTLEIAGLDAGQISELHVGAGLAGLNMQREIDRAHEFPHPYRAFNARSDAHIACYGAHGGGDGGIVIVGTGTCIFGLLNGAEISLGGRGFVMADQGSAADLGRKALRHALQAMDGITPYSGLASAIADRFDYQPDKMVVWSETAQSAGYGRFARLVFDVANAGDETANRLIAQTAEDVALLIDALPARGLANICLVGGMAEAITPFLPARSRQYLKPKKGDALSGALMLARNPDVQFSDAGQEVMRG
jgi:glucosamine kinase